jgi:hypothetical protein
VKKPYKVGCKIAEIFSTANSAGLPKQLKTHIGYSMFPIFSTNLWLGRLEAAEEGLEELTTTCRVAAVPAELPQWLLPPLAGPLWANGGCEAWA